MARKKRRSRPDNQTPAAEVSDQRLWEVDALRGVAIIMMVISEFVAATNGIGFVIWSSRRTFDLVNMWSGVILLGLLGYGLNLLLLQLERRILAWHIASRGANNG